MRLMRSVRLMFTVLLGFGIALAPASAFAGVESGTPNVTTFPHGQDALAYSPDGKHLYTAVDGVVYDVDPETGTIVHTIDVPTFVTWSIVFTSDSKHAFVAGHHSHNIAEIDVVHHVVEREITSAPGAMWLAVSPDQHRLYVSQQDQNSVAVVDISQQSAPVIDTIPVGNSPEKLVLTNDGRRLFVTNYSASSVSVIDTHSATVTRTLSVHEVPWEISASPDGRWIVVGHEGDFVSFINTNNYAVTAVPLDVSSYGLAVSPDSHHVLVTSWETPMLFDIDVSDSFSVTTRGMTNDMFGQLAFRPDGCQLAANNNGGTPVVQYLYESPCLSAPISTHAPATLSNTGESSADATALFIVAVGSLILGTLVMAVRHRSAQ